MPIISNFPSGGAKVVTGTFTPVSSPKLITIAGITQEPKMCYAFLRAGGGKCIATFMYKKGEYVSLIWGTSSGAFFDTYTEDAGFTYNDVAQTVTFGNVNSSQSIAWASALYGYVLIF